MKFLLGSIFAALLIAPLAFTGQQDTATTGDAIAHCGKCGKGDKKCKEGCECEKSKKAAEEKAKEKEGEALLAEEGKCKKKCKKQGTEEEEAALLAA